MEESFYVILDGGFVKQKLYPKLGRSLPGAEDISYFVDQICKEVGSKKLVRSFWYDAEPLSTTVSNPISSQTMDFGRTATYKKNTKLFMDLEELDNFAVRRGRLACRGWKLTRHSLKKIQRARTQGQIQSSDLEPNIEQKGVDMKIGIDIARIAFKKTADSIVIVAGDADLVPAMKLARIEGIRVYLHYMGHNVNRELKIHADRILKCKMVP